MPAKVTHKLDTATIAALITEGPDSATYRELVRRGNRVLNSAKRRCPVDEGRLRASLAMDVRVGSSGKLAARVGSNLDYAVFVHEGTGIYAGRGYIKPVRASMLRWPVKNNSGKGRRRYKGGKTAKYAYAKRVRGVPPRPFLRDALADM